MKRSLPLFGRIPLRSYLVVAAVGIAALLAALACVTPWYAQTFEFTQPGAKSTFHLGYPPGPQGFVHSCTVYSTSDTTTCALMVYNYSAGNGTALLEGLYLGILGAMITAAVLAFLGACLMVASAVGMARARRGNSQAVVMMIAATIIAAGAAVAMPVLQGPALSETGACNGYNVSQTPCNSVFGHSGGVVCNGGTCLYTDFNWYPDEGWYLALGSIGLLGGALFALRYHPLTAPCPTCGRPNRYKAEYCESCGNLLTLQPPKNPSKP